MKGFSKEQIISAVQGAVAEAQSAARVMYAQVGERDACGFGWVEIYVGRTNSKEAKALIEAGFRKSYKPKCLTLWDPAGLPVQNVDVKAVGADALATYLQALGLKAYGCSRLD